MAALQRILFREPDNRWRGPFFVLLSVICILWWMYFGIVLNGSHSMLFLSIAFAFYGILSIGTLSVFLALLVFIPDEILG
jgi:bacteriorhodopsin